MALRAVPADVFLSLLEKVSGPIVQARAPGPSFHALHRNAIVVPEEAFDKSHAVDPVLECIDGDFGGKCGKADCPSEGASAVEGEVQVGVDEIG